MKLMTTFFFMALATMTMANDTWTETFKLPEGTTYRAKAAGFDCGTFNHKYVQAPIEYRERQVEFKQLSADKDLNKFLFEAVYPAENGVTCTYGVFFDRSRDTKTLNLTHSAVVTTEGNEEACIAGQNFLDAQLTSLPYEGSKRGLRYIAAQILTETANDVCESGNVRIVFDRRL